MTEAYDNLLGLVHELHDLEKVIWLLSWDREVIMPAAANGVRSKQIATVNKVRHERFISDETGKLIEDAENWLESNSNRDDDTAERLIKWLKRDYLEMRRLPADFIRRRDEASGEALQIWKKARETADFSLFAPSLQRSIELVQEMAGYLTDDETQEPYDALLSQYERGMKTADVRALFDAVKTETVPLIAAIHEKANAVDDQLLHQSYPVEKQQEIAPYFAEMVGYDFSRGHLGTATHPFASSMSRDDARITTRWNPNFISPAIFGVMHESGHAMYEQGTGKELERTPLARGTSMGIHESQSRLFENLVGRSRGFWKKHYNTLQEAFPVQLGQYSSEDFYRAINKVQPSYIRVEADELTYNMHIILRFELEQAMLNGDVNAQDLPDAWNSKMEELLGLTPPNDSLGCLQDIHWTRPNFGYFPTYALGNLYSVQLMETAKEQNSQIVSELNRGEVSALKRWLIENVHVHGRKYDPAELIMRISGKPLSHAPFVAYSKAKFGEIYGL